MKVFMHSLYIILKKNKINLKQIKCLETLYLH